MTDEPVTLLEEIEIVLAVGGLSPAQEAIVRKAADRIAELEARIRDKDSRIAHLENYAKKGPYDEWQANRISELQRKYEALVSKVKAIRNWNDLENVRAILEKDND